jgi:putative ABC transport system ATP-binding protein
MRGHEAARFGVARGRGSEERPFVSVGPTIEVEAVVKSFGAVRALRGVSLSVSAGEFVTIGGPSGAGKSTLLSLIGALDRPDSGRILVGGEPVPDVRHAVPYRRRTVGFVFQNNLLMPYLTAQGNIETALLAANLGRQRRRARARELLAEVGIAHRADHLPAQLSGGERQRAAIARSLANDPSLLLADEPTGSLDSTDRTRVLDLLMATRERRRMTLLIVTHDAGVIERADRVLRMADGRIAND